jgi:hypothetical protein
MDPKVSPALHNYMQELVANRHSVWDNFYQSGGYGMYPTTVFGFVLVLAACIYSFRLEQRFIPVVVTTGILTVASGILGTFTGLMVVFTYVQHVEPGDAAKVAVVGAAQAFANIVFALLLTILGGLATLGGVLRQALRPTP